MEEDIEKQQYDSSDSESEKEQKSEDNNMDQVEDSLVISQRKLDVFLNNKYQSCQQNSPDKKNNTQQLAKLKGQNKPKENDIQDISMKASISSSSSEESSSIIQESSNQDNQQGQNLDSSFKKEPSFQARRKSSNSLAALSNKKSLEKSFEKSLEKSIEKRENTTKREQIEKSSKQEKSNLDKNSGVLSVIDGVQRNFIVKKTNQNKKKQKGFSSKSLKSYKKEKQDLIVSTNLGVKLIWDNPKQIVKKQPSKKKAKKQEISEEIILDYQKNIEKICGKFKLRITKTYPINKLIQYKIDELSSSKSIQFVIILTAWFFGLTINIIGLWIFWNNIRLYGGFWNALELIYFFFMLIYMCSYCQVVKHSDVFDYDNTIKYQALNISMVVIRAIMVWIEVFKLVQHQDDIKGNVMILLLIFIPFLLLGLSFGKLIAKNNKIKQLEQLKFDFALINK